MKHFLLAGLAALAVAGCGDDYGRTDISAVVGSFTGPTSVSVETVSVSHIQITDGNIVKAHIVVYDDDEEPMPLTIKVTEPGVIDVQTVVSDGDFSFAALRVGTTQVQLIADGTRVLTIKADVVPQPSP